MAYVPPPPGSTAPGQPTPEGVAKQSVHITDLPPEVRKNFLMSMIFFPSMVGAAICAVMFLGWVTIFKPKEPAQYALELGSSDMRRRWTAARELSEHIAQYGETQNTRIYSPDVLSALIEILENPDLDRQTSAWSPSGALRQDDEKGSLRSWAARTIGHIGARMTQASERERAFNALTKALEEKELTHVAARGLAYMYDVRASDALIKHLNEDPDSGNRCACAEALGAIGWGAMQAKEGTESADKIRLALKHAYDLENAKPKRDEDVLDNVAISLARVKDSSALNRLRALEKHADPSVRDQARRALDILEK